MTLGRNQYDYRNLRAIRELMKTCDGAVIIGLSRRFLPRAVERAGSAEQSCAREVVPASPIDCDRRCGVSGVRVRAGAVELEFA